MRIDNGVRSASDAAAAVYVLYACIQAASIILVASFQIIARQTVACLVLSKYKYHNLPVLSTIAIMSLGSIFNGYNLNYMTAIGHSPSESCSSLSR